ncbi:MAG: hypothetical protein NZ700_12230, partial [Gemmataceae bacterium]|nr:hypothetical protein [Gemmataceae bacterium]
ALTVAVEQTVGLLLDAQTILENDKIIQERILTASNAYIEKYDIVKRRQSDGLHVCTIKAVVRTRKLEQNLLANRIAVGKIAGRDLATESRTTQKSNADISAVLSDLLKDLPTKVLTAKVTDKPKPFTVGDTIRLRVPIELGVDDVAYAAQVKKITTAMDRLAITKFRSVFKLLPQRPISRKNPIEEVRWQGCQLKIPSQSIVKDVATFPPPDLLVPARWFAVGSTSISYNDSSSPFQDVPDALIREANAGFDGGIDRVRELQKQKGEPLGALVIMTSLSSSGSAEVVTYALPEPVLDQFPYGNVGTVKLTVDLLDA